MPPQSPAGERLVLIGSIFIAGLCSIIYELLISTTSSYFLGDSVVQFSITIGVFMAAMGLGAWMSRVFQHDLPVRFIEVELLLGIVGGISVPLLYYAFAENGGGLRFSILMISLIVIIGALTGLEIPLLTRIMKQYYPLKINLSNVLSLDYLGALAATLLFPFVLLPWLGVFASSLVFGLVNILLAGLNLRVFRNLLSRRRRRRYGMAWGVLTAGFIIALFLSGAFLAQWQDQLFRDRIVYAKTTPYQNLVLTKRGEEVRLYIDRIIQFSSFDEYRYHESLVHPAFSVAPYHRRVLVLGGGEGLAVREILKYPAVEAVVVVDIDPEVFRLGRTNPHVTALNGGALDDERVTTIAQDAFRYLQAPHPPFDLVIVDLPDPSNENLARLYSREFFMLIFKQLTPNGIMVTQATSPFHTRKAFWCIAATVRAAGFTSTRPYHAYVPSFGDWGFVLGAKTERPPENIRIDVPTHFLNDTTVRRLFYFEPDLRLDSILPSTLDRPRLLEYYLADWRRWSRPGE